MKVMISHISDTWRPVAKGKENGKNLVVVTQAVEEGEFQGVKIQKGKTIKLNLNSEQRNLNEWLSALTEGSVLDVQLYKMGMNLVVNKYGTFNIIKQADGKKASK